MCDPVSAIAAASTGIKIAGDVLQANAQNKRAKQVATAADQNATEQIRQLDIRSEQEQDSTAQGILQADRQARFADAQERVQSGEAGVAGASVDAVLNDIQSQKGAYDVSANINLQDSLAQINEEKIGVRTQAENEKLSAQPANPWATGVQIGGALLGGFAPLINRNTKANS